MSNSIHKHPLGFKLLEGNFSFYETEESDVGSSAGAPMASRVRCGS